MSRNCCNFCRDNIGQRWIVLILGVHALAYPSVSLHCIAQHSGTWGVQDMAQAFLEEYGCPLGSKRLNACFIGLLRPRKGVDPAWSQTVSSLLHDVWSRLCQSFSFSAMHAAETYLSHAARIWQNAQYGLNVYTSMDA